MTALVVVLAAVGLYVSAHMQAKSAAAARGEIRGASVVKTRRAHLFGHVPNSVFGLAYYLCAAIAAFFQTVAWVHVLTLIAAAFAAATSLYLAYSLLFVTRRPCAYCWTAHAVNWALLAVFLFFPR
jgi:uncharacterized membrane protein